MGMCFYFMTTDDLPVQPAGAPPGAPRGEDDAEWMAANARYWDARPEERGVIWPSWSGVGILTEALAATGVLIEMEHGPWPDVCWRETADGEQEPTEAGRAFLSQGAGRAFRVPSFKFDSNDGWIFTPQECQWMAYALRTHPDSFARDFGRFCEVAAQHGGLTTD